MSSVSACHRATEAECEAILDRIVELELKDQGITDPGLLQARKADTRSSKHDELVGKCVGKRVSQSALECIEKASSSADITEKCLR